MKAKNKYTHPPRVVEILWRDAATTHGWRGQSEPGDKETVACRTSGYLLRRTKKEITVSQNLSEYDSTGEWMTIPMSCVSKIRRLS